jgi:MipA family protein
MSIRISAPMLAILVATAPAHAETTRRQWDAAVTLVASHGPDYLGARESGIGVRPGLLVRYGRVSLSSGAGFAARRQDVELQGLGIELAHSDQFDLTLSLRNDSGRSESDSAALAGMGDVKRTVRLRVATTWHFLPQWYVKGAWTVDAFGRGGGHIGEVKLQHSRMLTPTLELTSGASLNVAGATYLRTYYGVTPEQSARSGYPVYTPGSGLRDIGLFARLKAELGHHWVLVGGTGYSRLLGPAADSPLAQRPSAFTFSAGIGYRF